MQATRITWRVKRLPRREGWEGFISFPDIRGFQHTLSSTASSPTQAVNKAGALAAQLANNPAVQALMPPGGAAALKLAGKIAGSAAAKKAFKKLKKFW